MLQTAAIDLSRPHKLPVSVSVIGSKADTAAVSRHGS
jgi:hypothetical protein